MRVIAWKKKPASYVSASSSSPPRRTVPGCIVIEVSADLCRHWNTRRGSVKSAAVRVPSSLYWSRSGVSLMNYRWRGTSAAASAASVDNPTAVLSRSRDSRALRAGSVSGPAAGRCVTASRTTFVYIIQHEIRHTIHYCHHPHRCYHVTSTAAHWRLQRKWHAASRVLLQTRRWK